MLYIVLKEKRGKWKMISEVEKLPKTKLERKTITIPITVHGKHFLEKAIVWYDAKTGKAYLSEEDFEKLL